MGEVRGLTGKLPTEGPTSIEAGESEEKRRKGVTLGLQLKPSWHQPIPMVECGSWMESKKELILEQNRSLHLNKSLNSISISDGMRHMEPPWYDPSQRTMGAMPRSLGQTTQQWEYPNIRNNLWSYEPKWGRDLKREWSSPLWQYVPVQSLAWYTDQPDNCLHHLIGSHESDNGESCQQSLVRYHKYLKLGNKMTNFSGTANPVTNSNISTGSLYLILRAPTNTLSESWNIIDSSTARLRYVD